MNAERLHSVLAAVLADNEQHNYPALLQSIESAYTSSIQTPDAPRAAAYSQALSALKSACAAASVNGLSLSPDVENRPERNG